MSEPLEPISVERPNQSLNEGYDLGHADGMTAARDLVRDVLDRPDVKRQLRPGWLSRVILAALASTGSPE